MKTYHVLAVLLLAPLMLFLSCNEDDPDSQDGVVLPVPDTSNIFISTSNNGLIGQQGVLGLRWNMGSLIDADYLNTGRFIAATEQIDYTIFHSSSMSDWTPVDDSGNALDVAFETLGQGVYTHSSRYVNSGVEYWKATVEQEITMFNPDDADGPLRACIVDVGFTWEGGVEADSLYLGWAIDFDVATTSLIEQFDACIDDHVGYDFSRSLVYMWDGDDTSREGDDTGEDGTAFCYVGLMFVDGTGGPVQLQWLNWEDGIESEARRFGVFSRELIDNDGVLTRDLPESIADYNVLVGMGPYSPEEGEVISLRVAVCMGVDLWDLQTTVDSVLDWVAANPQ